MFKYILGYVLSRGSIHLSTEYSGTCPEEWRHLATFNTKDKGNPIGSPGSSWGWEADVTEWLQKTV